VITKLLIANRARSPQIIRTARAMDISTVALYSDADQDRPTSRRPTSRCTARHRAIDTYLRSDLVLAAAGARRRRRAPGYGFPFGER